MEQKPKLPSIEYIVLVAMLTSIVALATDVMLPALDIIGEDLNAPRPNDVHYIVTIFFLGYAIGQLIAGPLSDTIGRKPAIYIGYVILVIGCIISMLTESWTIMLAARLLQGIGAASPRIVTMALIRDEHAGRPMARIMSIVMAVFILVPIVAPAIGQGLIYMGGWPLTFAGLMVLAIAVSIWFALRQPETLAPENRRPFNPKKLGAGVVEVIKTRAALGYTLAAGCIFGAFMGYLGSAAQIFKQAFEVGDLFAFYFAVAAMALGVSSLTNAAFVMRLGMYRLSLTALIGLTVLSFAFWLILPMFEGIPPLWLFLAWQLAAFFCVGITFANINAMALEPLGHMAGLGAAFIGSISTFIALPLASLIGNSFDGTVYPLVVGFAVLGLMATLISVWTEQGFRRSSQG